MNKKIIVLFITCMIGTSAFTQISEADKLYPAKGSIITTPFLFSETTLTSQNQPWSLDYSGSYGERVDGNFGYSGVGQQFAVKGYVGNRFTFYANTAFGFASENKVASAQQIEVIRDLIGGKKLTGLRFGVGLGASRDYSNVKSLLSRVTMYYDAFRWKIGGNLLFEKALAKGRDDIDIITSFGFHYQLLNNLYAGVEAMGEDLEGFWDEDEAEGGAKLMIGPSINLAPNHSRLSFSVSGGPVMYATRSELTNPDAIRELPSQNGLTVRVRVIFNISGS